VGGKGEKLTCRKRVGGNGPACCRTKAGKKHAGRGWIWRELVRDGRGMGVRAGPEGVQASRGQRAGMFFEKILRETCQRRRGGMLENRSEQKTCWPRLDLEGAGEERPRNGSSGRSGGSPGESGAAGRHVFREDSQRNMPEKVWWRVEEQKRAKNMPAAVRFGGSW